MKKLILTLVIVVASLITIAQSPQSFNYQALLRNSSGQEITDQSVGIQISILQSGPTGTAVYVERFTSVTNEFGLINLAIGTGSVQSGTFSAIDWSSGPYYLKVELDENGGTTFTEIGTSQLLSVPYALHAGKADNYDETDPAIGSNTINYLSKWDGTSLVKSGIFDIGKIGIGTGAPQHFLDIRADGHTQVVSDADYFSANIFSYHDNGLLVHTGFNDGVDIARFSAIGTGFIEVPRFVIKDNGNIGI